METQSKTQSQVSIQYGIIMGLALVISSIIFYALGQFDSMAGKLMQWPILGVFIFLGIKELRDKSLGGYITYGKSLGTGTLISLFAGIIVAIYFFVFISYIAPEFVNTILDKAEEAMLEKGLSDTQIQQSLSMQKKFMSPVMMSVFSVVGTTVSGVVVSLVIGLFTKKNDPSFESKFK